VGLECDDTGQIISYEEYHPYGTTAYQARNGAVQAAAKRYRYTGMERDEETGLAYHTARYYLPWMGRWGSCDPIGVEGGENLYGYSSCNPIFNYDKTGKDPVTININTPNSLPEQKLSHQELSNISFYFSRFSTPIVIEENNTVFILSAIGAPEPTTPGWISTIPSFVENALYNDSNDTTDITINSRLYNIPIKQFYDCISSGFKKCEMPASVFPWQSVPIGDSVGNGSVSGTSSRETFYFTYSNSGRKGAYSFGKGNPPHDGLFGEGGATPIIINGIPFHSTNLYKKGAPEALPPRGDPGSKGYEWLTHRSNSGFEFLNRTGNAAPIFGVNNQYGFMIIVASRSGQNSQVGMSVSWIRDTLLNFGIDNAVAFDGSDSTTLILDSQVLVKPGSLKDKTIPSGITFRIPKTLEERLNFP